MKCNLYNNFSYQKCSQRGHLYFFVSSGHSKHFIVGLLLIAMWEAKPKQCANICQNGQCDIASECASFSTWTNMGVEIFKSDARVNSFSEWKNIINASLNANTTDRVMYDSIPLHTWG